MGRVREVGGDNLCDFLFVSLWEQILFFESRPRLRKKERNENGSVALLEDVLIYFKCLPFRRDSRPGTQVIIF